MKLLDRRVLRHQCGAEADKSRGHATNGWSRPLSILAVTNRWPRPGHHGGIFVKQLVDGLRSLGHQVDVELVAQQRGRLDYLLAARRVRARATQRHYDVVHVHYGLTAMAATLVSGTPRVLSLYGSDVNVPWQRRISLGCSRGFEARIYVSARLAKAAGDANGTAIPNGVDLRTFSPGDRVAARAALGVTGDEHLVLFGGNPERTVKGWDVFSEVVDLVSTNGLPVRPLVLTEQGQTEEQLVRKYDAADVLLFTSRRGSEGSPTVVKEAIAMGLPVVAVDVGDVAERLDGVEPSWVVPFPLDSDAGVVRRQLVSRLAAAVQEALRRGGRSNGRALAADLSLEASARRVATVLAEAART